MTLFWIFFVLFILVIYTVFKYTIYDVGTTVLCAVVYIFIVFVVACNLIPTRIGEVKVPIQIVERPDAIYVFADKYSFPYNNFETIKYLQTNPDSAVLINYYNTYGGVVKTKLKFYK